MNGLRAEALFVAGAATVLAALTGAVAGISMAEVSKLADPKQHRPLHGVAAGFGTVGAAGAGFAAHTLYKGVPALGAWGAGAAGLAILGAGALAGVGAFHGHLNNH